MKNILTFLSLFACLAAVAQGPDIKVEPPSWWTGMANSQLQLLVEGEGVGGMTASIEEPGIALLGFEPAANNRYLVVNLDLSGNPKAGTYHLVLKENGAIRHRVPYVLHEREPGSADRQGFTNKDVIYLITPDRFANGDPSNDKVEGMPDKTDRSKPGARHGGDLEGIRQHLDYLENLGITGLWLNPVLENNMPGGSYHGYAITDFYQVDARFGNNEMFRALSKEAKNRGMMMVMDQVINHCGSAHRWMDEKPYPDWINLWEEGENGFKGTNHRRTTLVDPHAATSDLELFQDGWFVPSMPDLNQRNPVLATYLIQNSIWWIEYADLGGIRMDTYSYPDRDFMAKWTQAIMAEYPRFSIVGEEWFPQPAIVAQWQRGNDNGYPSELNSLMDFPSQMSLIRALKEKESWNAGFLTLYETLAHDFLYPDPDMLMVFADNHDMSRIFTQLDEDLGLYLNAMAFVLTTRGIPQIFYGTEILMSHPGTDAHEVIRSDFPGGWPGDKVDAFSGKGLSPEAKQTQDWMRAMLQWRKESPAIHTSGNLTHYGPLHDGLYVYFRHGDGQHIMVVLNKNEQPVSLDLGRFSNDLNGATRATVVPTGEEVSLEEPLSLQPGKPLILNWFNE